MTRETVIDETPAWRATSWIVTTLLLRRALFRVNLHSGSKANRLYRPYKRQAASQGNLNITAPAALDSSQSAIGGFPGVKATATGRSPACGT